MQQGKQPPTRAANAAPRYNSPKWEVTRIADGGATLGVVAAVAPRLRCKKQANVTHTVSNAVETAEQRRQPANICETTVGMQSPCTMSPNAALTERFPSSAETVGSSQPETRLE